MLVVLGEEDGYADRSFGNLPEVQTIVAGELNAYDILVNDWVVFTDETLPGGSAGRGRRRPVDRRRPVAADADAECRAGESTADGMRRADEPPNEHRRGQRRSDSTDQDSTDDRRKRVMRDPHNVLIRPVVSEKSYALMDNNVYVFVVDPSATKIDVRHAVEQAFNVRVDNVNTLNRKGKTKRNRKNNALGHRPDTKRAIVTLARG